MSYLNLIQLKVAHNNTQAKLIITTIPRTLTHTTHFPPTEIYQKTWWYGKETGIQWYIEHIQSFVESRWSHKLMCIVSQGHDNVTDSDSNASDLWNWQSLPMVQMWVFTNDWPVWTETINYFLPSPGCSQPETATLQRPPIELNQSPCLAVYQRPASWFWYIR